MTLDILVPQYKEDEKQISNLLNSIALQQNINFNSIGVIIVNDGSDVILSDEFLNNYPFKITYIKNEHKGVSATRQRALDESKANYVMFCDADDMFFNLCGLWLILNETVKNFDVLNPIFLEEAYVVQSRSTTFINKGKDVTYIHGKVFRRQYLVDNNIRWEEKLTIHEDSYFISLAHACTKNVLEFQTPYYLWKFRNDSVCRADPLYLLKTYQMFIESNDCLIQQLLRRNMYSEAKYFFNALFYDMYFVMNKPDWLAPENQHYVEGIFKVFVEHYKKYISLTDIDNQLRAMIIQQTRNKYYAENVFFDAIRFEDWMKKLNSLAQ